MLFRSNFSSFPHYFIYIFLTSGVKLHIHLLNVVVQFIVFLTLSTLICRSTDISKCFSESLGIRDNGSQLFFCFCAVICLSMAYIISPFPLFYYLFCPFHCKYGRMIMVIRKYIHLSYGIMICSKVKDKTYKAVETVRRSFVDSFSIDSVEIQE